MLNSFQKNKYGIFLMLISSLCVSFGQYMWKISNGYDIFYLIVGFILYGIGALVMLIAYKFGSLSVLHPVLSVNNVFTIFIAIFLLSEAMTVNKLLGIFAIMIGTIFIGGGDG